MMTRKLKSIPVAVVMCALLSACVTTGDNQMGGALIGGTLGGLAGSQIGTGEGRLAATAIGAMAGAMIGASAGAQPDTVYYPQRDSYRSAYYGRDSYYGRDYRPRDHYHH